jgi:signal transduction histidine kinase
MSQKKLVLSESFTQEDIDALQLEAGEALLLSNESGEVVFVSDEAACLLKVAPDSLLGRPLTTALDISNKQDIQLIEQLLSHAHGEGALMPAYGRFGFTVFNQKLNLVFIPHRTHKDNVLYFCIGFVPGHIGSPLIPETYMRERQRGHSIAVLAAGIAHDFNNLLTGILGNLSLAQNCSEGSTQRNEAIRSAEQAAFRARDLTHQLLSFAKGGAPVKEKTSMAELLREATSFLLCGGRGQCALDIPDDLWPVHVDEGQISQVLSNVLINGIEASSSTANFYISAENCTFGEREHISLEPGRYVHVSIHDTGPGMDKEDLVRIFEPYFTTKESGNGLGLASAYSIVSSHGGLLCAESELGNGATFHIYLPASDVLDARFEKKDAVIHPGKGRVLVMDDEAMIQQIAGEMLKQLGYQVECAHEGRNAIEKYEEAIKRGHPFDTVILDLTVPLGLGGKATLERLRAQDPEVKAIVSSGYSHDDVMENFKNFGFSGRVVKPYTLQQLSEVLHSVLSN